MKSNPGNIDSLPGVKSRKVASAGPVRTCVGCRRRDDQAALVRVTRDGAKLLIKGDSKRRLLGRGAYVHAQTSCLNRAQKGGFDRSFRTAIQKTSFVVIREQILNMRSEGSNE